MVKIAWKVINGYGPYAYLQESVKNNGKVTSKHIAYLGAAGKNGLVPGKKFTVPPSEDFEGVRLMVPFVGEETVDALKPGPLAAIQSMKAQVEAGAAKKDIVVPGKGKSASTKAAAVAPKKKDKVGSVKGKTEVAPNTGETATAGHQAPAVSPGQAAAPKASPAPKLPLANDGKPIVSAAHAKSLEKAAATGDPKALVAAMHEAAGKVKKHHNQTMIYSAASDLFAQMQATESTESLPAGSAAAGSDLQLDILPKVKGQHLLSEQWTKLLEDAAATGDATALAYEVNELKASTWAPGGSTKNLHDAITVAHSQLKEQVDDAILANAVTNGKAKVVSAAKDGWTKEPLITKAEIKQIEAAAETGDAELVKATSDLLAAKYATTDYKKLQAIVAAGKSVADQVKAIGEGAPGSLEVAPPAPEKVAPDNQATAPDTLDAQGVVKEKPTLYPKMIQWAHGKPLVAPDEVEKLEAAAATGDVGAVEQAMTKLVSPKHTAEKNAAILNAAAFLSHQMADPQVQQVHKALYGPAKVAPNNQGPAAAPFVEDVSTPTPAAAPKLPPHLSSVLKIAQVMKLEELAAAGDPDELTAAAGEMADLTLDSKAYSATHSAKHYLLGHMQPLPETPSYTEAVVGGNQDDMSFLHKAQAALNSDNFLKMPGTGEPKMSEETTEKLLAAAAAKDPKILEAHGNALQYEFPEDDPEFSGIAVATDTLGKEVDKAIHGEQSIWWAAADAAQAPAPETSPAPGPAAGLAAGIGGGEQVAPNNQGAVVDQQAGAAAPAWKLMEGPKGSTPGGLYEDQQGNKAYIKVPQSQQHVRNELLAQDLYKLAGVDVLQSGETELQGQPAIASDWSEGFTGSGVNPKDLPGTKEGFVADAWLANWDSVGVGSSKYDNILNLDGKAVRVDVGGSLLFRATGGPKSDKFGNVVTELEGLRDPALNPVAATVYGDMTPEEINASAQAVVGISDNAIEEAVRARFPDDPALASELAEKLIARRNYISEWVEKSSQPAAQAVSDASADAGEAVVPNIPSADAAPELPGDGPPKVTTDIPLAYYTGKPLIHPTHVKKMETAAALGDIKLLQQTMQDAKGKNPGYNKEQVVSEAAQSLLDQMVAKAQASAPAAAQKAAPPPPPLQLAPKLPEEILTFEGEIMLNGTAVKSLEEAAATGSWDKLNEAAAAIPKPGTTWKENYGHNNVLQNAKDVLTQQVKAAKQEAANSYALSLGKPKIVEGLTYDDEVNPLPENQAVLLEKAAATGDKALVEALARIFQGQHSSFSKEAKGLNAARDSLLQQMATLANANYQTIPAGDLGLPASTTGAGVASWIPTDKFGKPMVSSANAKKLEKAAASGEVKELSSVMVEAADKITGAAKKQALYKGGIALLEQMQAGKADQAAAETPEASEMDQPTWRPVVSPKVPEYIKNQYSDFDLPDTVVKQLEAAAATGNAKKLSEVADDLVEQSGDFSAKSAIIKVEGALEGEIEQAIIDAAIPNAVATGKAKIAVVPKTSNGNLLIQDQHVQQLETVANAGDPGFLSATASLISSEYHYIGNKNAIANAAQSLQDQISAIAAGGTGQPEQAPTVSAGKPKLTEVPVNNKGKTLIAGTNVKKLEKAAASGVDELQEVADALAAKMASPAKKAAILNAAAELKGQVLGSTVMEGDGGSGLGDTMASVNSGEVKLPSQEVPLPKVVKKHRNAMQQGKKNYDADLTQVSGKKGSNEGGLFKDKHLDSLHYIKWPNSETRAKMEALTALMYSHAEIPVPSVRVIKFQDKDAVMSDWIDDAAPMSFEQMSKHPDVRAGFLADAWLANWDVVGLAADNIVTGPGKKAYRIDVGGSMLFRAQGKGKPFPPEVSEIETLRSPTIAPQASKVFDDLTSAELVASAERIAAITDDQIDFAVDSVALPKTSPEYPASQFGPEANDLPQMVKTRLKQRRDYIIENVLKQEQKKAATLQELKDLSDLKDKSVEIVADKAGSYKINSPSSGQKWTVIRQLMASELGKNKGQEAADAVHSRYSSWKGSSISGGGSALRWGTGQLRGEGRRELRRLDRFNEFLVKEGELSAKKRKEYAGHMQQVTSQESAQDLVDGLRVANEQNELLLAMKHPGKKEITIYRGWKPQQAKYLGLLDAKVGSVVDLDDPPIYSWSFSPGVAHKFAGGHGSFVAKATVPRDSIILTDLANTTGSYTSEDEVIFNGVNDFHMEIIKKS